LKVRILFERNALRFFKKSNKLTKIEAEELLLKAAEVLNGNKSVNLDLKAMKGKYLGYMRIRKGDIRIIFCFKKNEILLLNVIDIDERGNIY